MTARVRFSNGQVVQYNSATKILHTDSGQAKLLNADDNILATIQPGADCVIEWVTPCSVEWPGKSIKHLAQEIRERGRQLNWSDMGELVDLKRYLDGFDARSRRWK